MLDWHGLAISSLAYYPNNLHPDPGERRAANTHLRKVIDAASALGVPTVGTFVGRDPTKNVPDNVREFRKVWPKARGLRGGRGVNVAIENCPMLFSWDEWPGGTNLASSPALPGRALHDRPVGAVRPQPRPLAPRVAADRPRARRPRLRLPDPPRPRAKDMEIDRDGLYRNGVLSLGMGWQIPRLPGLGEVRPVPLAALPGGLRRRRRTSWSTRIVRSRAASSSSSADSLSRATRSARTSTDRGVAVAGAG